MEVHKNEITTGLLVVGTFTALTALIVAIAMPGLLHPLNTYRVYFDNAAGIRPGAPVMLGGREVGKVTNVQSPLPLNQRPSGHPEDEVYIEVQVPTTIAIYNKVSVHMAQQGLMGLQAIDFVEGDPASGLAQDHSEFVGARIPSMSEAMAAVVDNVKALTGPDSDLAKTITNLRTLTGPDSPLASLLVNVDAMTKPNSDLAGTLQNTHRLTGPNSNLAATLANTKKLMTSLNKADVAQVITNAKQFTDTLKHQPWRLIWPSTKHYADDPQPSDKKAVTPMPGVKK